MSEQQSTAQVLFLPAGRRGRLPHGTSLLDAARTLGIELATACGGQALCGRCRIRLVEGHFAEHGIRSCTDHLSPIGPAEQACATRLGIAGKRLGCQARLWGDAVVEVPPESQARDLVVCKTATAATIALDPPLRLYVIDIPPAATDEGSSDLDRVLLALQRQWGLAGLHADLAVIRRLQDIRRADCRQLTVAIRDGEEIVALWSGHQVHAYGVAIDLGSTTIAAHLCDLVTGEILRSAGIMNPQISFGEDLMSRISFALQNDGAANAMTGAVRRALDDLLLRLAREARIAPADILEITLVGNPLMHHLVLGLDPRPLGLAPFTAATHAALNVGADELGLTASPAARIYVLPCIGGHVGADSAAVILAEGLGEQPETRLVIDIGTNAEILLARAERVLAASSPTGPAFEGAQISCGQRAVPGAIERVRIDPTTLEPRFKLIGSECWSDQPGFAAAMPTITGLCGSGILEAVAELYLCGVIGSDGVIDGGMTARSARIVTDGAACAYVLHAGEPCIRISQNDVRAIQLAKAALYAGAEVLMRHLGVNTVDEIRLAGAFGSNIDPKYAMVIGMIPDCDLDRVAAAGNAAGTGARIALLNRASRGIIEARARQVEKIETAVAPEFQTLFVDAMAFPHRTAPFARLASRVEIPARAEVVRKARRGRSRAGPPHVEPGANDGSAAAMISQDGG
jgi:uncharacterized 2Fe-2S/4Fe-4S cluster protein (DUF4445 family)